MWSIRQHAPQGACRERAQERRDTNDDTQSWHAVSVWTAHPNAGAISERARKAAWYGKGFARYATCSCSSGLGSDTSRSRPPLPWKTNSGGCLRRRRSVCADAGSEAEHAGASSHRVWVQGQCVSHVYMRRSEDVSAALAPRGRDAQDAAPTRPASVWTLNEQTYRHGIHEKADATKTLSWTSGEESQARLSAVA